MQKPVHLPNRHKLPSTPRHWLAKLVHPAAELFPLLTDDEQEEMTKDVGRRGLTSAIILWAEGKDGEEPPDIPQVLDGRNRLRALDALGCRIEQNATGRLEITGLPRGSRTFELVRAEHADGTPWVDPWEYVLSANIMRRHLNGEQKRELIGKLLAERPTLSDRRIGKLTHTDNKTVGSVRKAMEEREEIPHVAAREDTKGRQQPSTKPGREPSVQPKRGEPIIDPASLSMAAQEKLDAAIRQHKRQLDLEYDRRLKAEIDRRIKEEVLPPYQNTLDDFSGFIKTRTGVMTAAEYRMIRACLHPDSLHAIRGANYVRQEGDDRIDARFAAAFRLFNDAKGALLSEKEMPTTRVVLTSEMRAARKAEAAKRRAQRAQGKSDGVA